MADQVTEVVYGIPVEVKRDEMVIGGAYQGKTDYAKQVYPNLVWSDGASCDLKDIFPVRELFILKNL